MFESVSPPPEPDFRRAFPDLNRLTPERSRVLISALRSVHVAAGVPIVEPGTDNDTLYFVFAGCVRVTLETERATLTLGELGAGHWFGEMAMIDPAPATATVRAADESTLLALDHERFLRLRRKHPDISSVLLLTLCNRLTSRLRETLQHLESGRESPEHRGALLDAARRLLGIAARSVT